MSFAAILSDLDGVLVDSGDAVERVWRAWALERGVDPELVARASHGVPSREVVPRVAPQLASEAEYAYVESLQAATGGAPLPGAAELLALPLPVAIVTSGSRPLVRARLRAAGLRAPAVVVTIDDVERGKPAPDPYLLGAARLGVAAGACLVVEDAPAGVAAGVAAGAAVWGVETTHTAAELRAAGAQRSFATPRELVRQLKRGISADPQGGRGDAL